MKAQVIGDVSGFGVLEGALRELDRRHPPETVYQSSEFLIPWLSYAARRSSPQAMILWEEKQARAVLPLVSDEVRRGPFRISRLGLPTHGGHPPSLDIRSGEKEAQAAAEALLSAFSARGARWQVLSLRHLSGNSALVRSLPDLCRERGLTFTWRPARRESYLVLGEGWDSYLARLKRHHRKEVNRVFRRIEETPGWEFVDSWPREDDVRDVLQRYLAAVRDSWKAEEARDEGFVDFLQDLMLSFARTGDLLVSWLRGPNGDGAALIQLRRGKVMAAFHQAYTSICPVKGAGTELLGHAIRYAYDQGMLIYDFSTSAEHIHRWSPLYRNTCHVYITKKTPLGWIIQRKLAARRRGDEGEGGGTGDSAAASEGQ